jgi:hypothetical protein
VDAKAAEFITAQVEQLAEPKKVECAPGFA